ncbi:hypothetical protein BCR44DRAFT_23850 [Catenaria anguillulae PL171]|uniref:Uncharacterized protein n=1 Tax=Catenaria anguillulae PL171 TaxID=765915 RepID=A0A1Y2HNL0_9FUNG|nr:hypothetical protein BCR44DRAFT_23850 [Catenaria anguillulae PL171]
MPLFVRLRTLSRSRPATPLSSSARSPHPQSKPIIHEEVRTFPGRGAVTDVTPQEVKEQARDREFHLLEVLTSLQQGHIASNATLIETIDRLQDLVASMNVNKYKLSSDGRTLLSDFESLLSTLREFILEKNEDEILQKLAFHANLAARGTAMPSVSGALPPRDTLAQRATGMTTLVRLLISNPNFRGILADFTDVFRSAYGEKTHATLKERILGDLTPGAGASASSAAGTTPRRGAADDTVYSQTGLTGDDSGIAAAYDDSGILHDTMHSRRSTAATLGRESVHTTTAAAGGDRRSTWGYGEPIVTRTLPPERKVYVDEPTTDEFVRAAATRPHPTTAAVVDRELSPGRLPHAHHHRHGGVRHHHQHHHRDARVVEEVTTTTTTERSGAAESAGMHSRQTTGVSTLGGTLGGGGGSTYGRIIPARAMQLVAQTRSAMTPQQQSILERRLRNLLRDLAADREYQESIGYLMSMIGTLAQSPMGTSTAHHVDANVYSVAIELKRLLESMAGMSMAPLIEAAYGFTLLMRQDAHLRELVADSRVFFERAVRDPTYLESREYATKLSVLQDRAMVWWQTEQVEIVLSRALEFLDALRSDRLSRALVRDVSQLSGTLLYSPSGRLAFKGDLVNDFRVVLLPAILQQIKFIALPRIEHRDADMDLILDNIVLTSANFLPNLFELEMVNRAQMSPRQEIDDRFTHVFSLNAYQIQADIRDISWYYRKRSGFPKVTDWGVMDLAITGEGISAKVMFEYDRHGAAQTLIPLRVRADVDEIRINLHHTKHDLLFKLAGPIIKSTIRKALITNIEQTILSYLLSVDRSVTMFKSSPWMNSMRSSSKREGAAKHAPSFLRNLVPGFVRGSHHQEEPRHPRNRQSFSRSRSAGGGAGGYRAARGGATSTATTTGGMGGNSGYYY